MNPSFTINAIAPQDRPWIRTFLTEQWGSVEIVSRGKVYFGDELTGFIAREIDSPAGLITYQIQADECEIITIDSLKTGKGIGSALLARVRQVAVGYACRRLWLITTNDNLPALRFYQKNGFRLVAVYPNAIEISRKLKPSIPLLGIDNIPIRDEIELELTLP